MNKASTAERALHVIPGGSYGHVNSLLMPEGFPQHFVRAEGARVWDDAGHEYLDLVAGYGSNFLGYRHAEVDAAAEAQTRRGDNLSLPAPVMVDLAERITQFATHAGWAMFAKNGTDANTLALAVARAHTGRRIVLMDKSAHHGSAPWCNPVRAGLLPEERAHQMYFQLGDISSLRQAVQRAGDDAACILTPMFANDGVGSQNIPSREFALEVRRLCDASGAIHIADEIRSGLWLARDCSWTLLDVSPDLSTWGKALGNGYAIAALCGSEFLRDAARRVYASGTYWFGATAMAAADTTLRIAVDEPVLEHINRLGVRLREQLRVAACNHGFELLQTGPVQMPQLLIGADPDFRFGFAWAKEMLAGGVYLHPWHNWFLCAAMCERDIDLVSRAAQAAFARLHHKRSQIEPPRAVLELINSLDHQ